jgi:lipopolysaccharide biosynthesis glycosyltransferase
MVLDLDHWRTERLGQAVLEDLQEHEHLYQFHDQCGLNAVLQNRWAALPPEWNVQTGSPVTKASPLPLSAAAALHFTGRYKPWHVAYGSGSGDAPVYTSYRRAWLEAARRSGWYTGKGWVRWRCTLAAKEAWLRLHRRKVEVARAVKTIPMRAR